MFSKFLIAASLLAPATAFAHISVGSGPAPAGKSQKIVVNVNHGCNSSTQDTTKIRIEIPAGFTSVRPMPSDFGKPVVTKVGPTVTSIEWTKPSDLNLAFDDAYYEITFKATVPNTPYTKVPIKIFQTCKDAGGTEIVVAWDNSDPAEPAPNLVIVPAKLNSTGWNKFTVPATTTVAAADFGAYFGDALIVWKGTAAFSTNPNTVTQIAGTPGVTPLTTDLAAGDEIWVRY